MEIKLDKYMLRFDPSEIRISIDGEKIDIGARTKEDSLIKTDFTCQLGKNYTIDASKNTIKEI